MTGTNLEKRWYVMRKRTGPQEEKKKKKLILNRRTGSIFSCWGILLNWQQQEKKAYQVLGKDKKKTKNWKKVFFIQRAYRFEWKSGILEVPGRVWDERKTAFWFGVFFSYGKKGWIYSLVRKLTCITSPGCRGEAYKPSRNGNGDNQHICNTGKAN